MQKSFLATHGFFNFTRVLMQIIRCEGRLKRGILLLNSCDYRLYMKNKLEKLIKPSAFLKFYYPH